MENVHESSSKVDNLVKRRVNSDRAFNSMEAY